MPRHKSRPKRKDPEDIRDWFRSSKAPRFTKWLGGAAGATLGFIAGNTQGAFYGGALGFRAGGSDRMVAVPMETDTRTENRAGDQVEGDHGPSDAGFSRFRFGRGVARFKKRGFDSVLAPRHHVAATFGRIQNNGVGFSSTQVVEDCTLYVPIGGGTTKYVAGSADMADVQLLFAADDPATRVDALPANVNATRRYEIKHIKVKVEFKNQGNTPVRMNLYNIVSRRDQNAAGFELPSVSWQTGLNNESRLASPNINFPGLTPFVSERFCINYKVMKVHKFYLHPGSSHLHFMKIRPSRLQMNEYNLQYIQQHMQTCFLMAVAEGQVINSAANPSNVAFAPVAVDYVSEYHAVAHCLEKSRTIYSFVNNVANITDPVTVTEDSETVTPAVIT